MWRVRPGGVNLSLLQSSFTPAARAGGPLKPGFGLSGEVHASQTCSARQLNYLHAMGTDTVSPQRAESLCYILLLPSPSPVYHGRKLPSVRVRLGTSAP